MEIIFLGTGSSTGTPVLGCDCATCQSKDPRNKRTRSSVAIKSDRGISVLIDTGPDLRLQALREGLLRVDAVLYTHTHADHLNGIDDLRNFCALQKMVIPVYGNRVTIEDIVNRFSYAFIDPSEYWDKPVLSAHSVDQPFSIGDAEITPIPVMHGKLEILGYRINNVAYITDVSDISAESLELLQGLEVMILDCLHYRPHRTHVHYEKARDYALAINARKTYFIHMTHDLEYFTLLETLPERMQPAFDGLRVTVGQ